MDETHVVTCFLRNRGEVLLLRRSEEVGSYPGKWAGVAGHAEGDPDAAARAEIAEETGLLDACALAREGVTFEFEDEALGTRWVVHPYLFDCDRRDAETDWESAESEWVHPTEIRRRDTVPNLWASYSRVAPTVQQVADDADHGSAYLSVRALEVLRDRARSFAERASRRGASDDWPRLAAVAERLLDVRPSMAAVGNRVNRAMAEAEGDRSAAAVERAAREGIERAYRADEGAAENAADEIRGDRVLTLSRSGTVLDALPAARRVFVAESRPAREGVGVAEELAANGGNSEGSGPRVTLHTDAAISHVLATEDVDALVVGADAVLPDGRVVNKTGTRGAALAANREGVPVYAVAASDKVRTDDAVHLEDGDPEAVYDGDAGIEALNPTFDVTPASAVSEVITERGALDEQGVSAVATELRELSAWRDGE
ncbi:NUDIX domain-containing protein [Halorussus limi]|uniref:NUDIX domain-containing protein n=1 Tax=Halorussus limi TaxID=2938695 RepID=A0A8U0HZ85_9EURY|nr:NUDIX domain-containing protein [Halorussus limi]UPV76113.1 NUDIX domain-containing protein [Halorussus limi]